MIGCSLSGADEGQRADPESVPSRAVPPSVSEVHYLPLSLQRNAGFQSAQIEAAATGSAEAPGRDRREDALHSYQPHREAGHVGECIDCGTVALTAGRAGAIGANAGES